MVYIIIVLAIFILILVARHFIMRREINRIVRDLARVNAEGLREKLIIETVHGPLENLCKQMNQGLEALDKLRIDAENHEAELRGQIANISHDLRTPLTAILGYAAMMKGEIVSEKSAEYLRIIETRAFVLQSLIEQFYELSLIENSQEALVFESVDAAGILAECLLGYYPLFEEKGIQPKVNLPEQAVMLTSNAQAMERIFQNLIQNALKFAKSDIGISLTPEGAFTISNDAENLVADDIDHIFERFYTADRSRTDGNTGLGLYIVKRLLENTGGGISGAKLENGRFALTIFLAKPIA